MATSTIIVIVAAVAILIVATIAWVLCNQNAPSTAASRPETTARKPPNRPTRWDNAKRSPTRRPPRAAPPEPRLNPWQRTRRAYNTRPKHTAATPPLPPATM
jgi:hypothetical protein